ncbi:hypothetical protein FRB90_001866, partial [Tulasnella sp. 427]
LGYSPIDRLPVELVEWIVWLAVTIHSTAVKRGIIFQEPRVKWVRVWRGVSQRWKSIIDASPSLWASIQFPKSTEDLEDRLRKSKRHPLYITVSLPLGRPLPPDDRWIQLLLDNAYRWKKISFRMHFNQVMARLNSSPNMLEWISVRGGRFPPDCTHFNSICQNLRYLRLERTFIPPNSNFAFGLEHLGLFKLQGDTPSRLASVNTIHRILRDNPGLTSLVITGYFATHPDDDRLQQLTFPNLETLRLYSAPILHLIKAERCAELTFWDSIHLQPTPNTWITPVHALRGAGNLHLRMEPSALIVQSAESPSPKVRIDLESMTTISLWLNLSFNVIDELLRKLTRGTSVVVKLTLSQQEGLSSLEFGLKVLERLKAPIRDPSSDQSRWFLPNLDTIYLTQAVDFPHQYLRDVVLARASGEGGGAPTPILRILNESGHNILNQVMDLETSD